MNNCDRIKINRFQRRIFCEEQYEEIMLGCSVQPKWCATESVVTKDNVQVSARLKPIRDLLKSKE